MSSLLHRIKKVFAVSIKSAFVSHKRKSETFSTHTHTHHLSSSQWLERVNEREQEGKINGKIESFNGIDFFLHSQKALTMGIFYFSFFSFRVKEICSFFFITINTHTHINLEGLRCLRIKNCPSSLLWLF